MVCLFHIEGEFWFLVSQCNSLQSKNSGFWCHNAIRSKLPPELYDAFISTVDKGNIRTKPNRSMPADPRPTPGAVLMGDAFNMHHPLTGGGETVALFDIVVLRNLLKPLRDLNDAPTLCNYLESFYTLRKPVASTINTLAGALYKVFCASPNQARKGMRQACFDYLTLGGLFSEGPISLLSGLNPRPLSWFSISLMSQYMVLAIYYYLHLGGCGLELGYSLVHLESSCP